MEFIANWLTTLNEGVSKLKGKEKKKKKFFKKSL
jgi:hypothetical protein